MVPGNSQPLRLFLLFLALLSFSFASLLGYSLHTQGIAKSAQRTCLRYEEPSIRMYFCPEDSCEEVLSSLITRANGSVECAFYDIDNNSVALALAHVSKRARVAMVLDTRTRLSLPFSSIHNSSHLMHHKFCVIDNKYVVTGSANPTKKGMGKNANNMVVVESRAIASKYSRALSRLRGDAPKEAGARPETACIKNARPLFCKEEDCRRVVAGLLMGARKSITGAWFSFTDKHLADIMAYKASKGIRVAVLINSGGYKGVMELLGDSGAEIMKDTHPYTMHNKLFVIDREIVVTGSANPGKGGYERNDEDIMILRDANLAERVLKEIRALGLKPVNCAESPLMIERVLPNPRGSDKGKEAAEILNKGNRTIPLKGWFLYSGGRVFPLKGRLRPGEVRQIIFEKSFLRNRNSTLSLFHLGEEKDRVSWGAEGKTALGEGDCLERRIHKELCSMSQWFVDKECASTKTFLNKA